MPLKDILLALLVMALWGANFGVSKMAMADFPPVMLMALRFALVAALLVPFRKPPRQRKQVLGLAVTLGVFHFPFLFSGVNLLDASTSAILMQLQVPFGVILAAAILRDRIDLRIAAGIVLSFAGVVLIAGEPRFEGSMFGIVLILIAAFAFGLSSVQVKTLGPVDPLALNGWLALLMAIELLILSLYVDGSPIPYIAAAGWRGWGGILFMAPVASIVGYGLWFRLVGRYNVNQIMPFLLTVPLFAVVSGVLLQNDRPTWDVLAGGFLTVAGVALIVFDPLRLVRAPTINPS